MFHVFLKPHRTSLVAENARPQKLFALLKVLPTATSSQSRPPQAWIFVIDGSGSMREKFGGATKIEVAQAAARHIVRDNRLSSEDLVGVVEFDDRARLLLPLSPMGDGQAAEAALSKLTQFQGGTHMGEGLNLALNELARLRTDVHIAKRVLVLTDGETTDEARCHKLSASFAGQNAPLVTLGVGDKYNENLLSDLSETTQGRPYHLGNAEEFSRVLEDEISSSTREVLGQVQLEAKTVRGVELSSVTRVYPHLAEVAGSSPYALGNIVAGDYSVWTLEFTVEGMERPPGRARLAQLLLTAREGTSTTESDMQDLTVSFESDEAAATQVDGEVLGYVQQRNADRLLREASRLAATDTQAANQKLQAALGLTRQVGNVPLTKTLENAVEELANTGTLSAGLRKTVMVSGRTRTVAIPTARIGAALGQNRDMTKTDATIPDEAAIRRMTEGR